MQKIAIIGAGNLSWHLAPALGRAGHEVAVFSRRGNFNLSWPVNVLHYDELVTYKPSVVILAVPDARITEVSTSLAARLPLSTTIIHTSGATALKKLNPAFSNRGVIWPIRSLLKGEPILTWNDLPVAYQGSNQVTTDLVREMVEQITFTSYELDSQQRAQLHLAAVYSNNFVTWMYQVSYELCEEKGIPFSTLLPIIRNTATKQKGYEPRLSQTGAAARGDQNTMTKHLKLLNGHPEWSRLYRLMSRLIQEGLED